MDVLKRISQLMDERHWTKYRLAKEADLAHSTISNMFSRNTAPTIPTLELLCNAFGITMAQFFAEDEQIAGLSEDQEILFAKWRVLTKEQQKALLDLISTM